MLVSFDLHTKYGILFVKPHHYVIVPSIWVMVRPTSQTTSITRSSGGRQQVSTFTAPIGEVRIVPAIPKHTSLCILLSIFFALTVCQPGHQTRNAKVDWWRRRVSRPLWASGPTPHHSPSYRPTIDCEPSPSYSHARSRSAENPGLPQDTWRTYIGAE
jgi:hypothetical protein